MKRLWLVFLIFLLLMWGLYRLGNGWNWGGDETTFLIYCMVLFHFVFHDKWNEGGR